MSEQDDKDVKENVVAAGSPEAGAVPTPESPAPGLPEPTPEERITALEAEKAEAKDRMLRIAAEFENYKKRARKEMTDQESKVRETVLRDFLEIVDNLERATSSFAGSAEKDVKSIKDGVDLVLRQFRSKLERYDVHAADAKGQPFDPRIHDAISQIPSADVPPGTVLQELQKGYRVGDRLLRAAMVVVSTAAPAAKAGEGKGDGVPAGDGSAESKPS
jgi:molecular chaperone GrpE